MRFPVAPRYSEEMQYQEFYHGEPITVSTQERMPGAWTSIAEFVIDRRIVRLAGGPEQEYASEEEARRAAVSTAAAAIDRLRTGRGKP
jgi:hypothetical protein